MRQHGFTLIELLLVLAAGAALLTLSTQTFRQLSERGLLTRPVEKITEALRFARSMAIGGRHGVSLCPSEDGHSCTSNAGYERGWIVFADHDNLGRRDFSEALLAVEQAFDPRITLRSNAFATFINFRADGRVNVNGSFVACADNRPNDAIGFTVIRSGRLRKTSADTVKQCHTS